MRELTKRQSEIYDYIKKIVQTKGYPPNCLLQIMIKNHHFAHK